MVLIEIDPVIILLRWRDLLFGFLEGHIWLSFFDLVQKLRPFFLALSMLFLVNLDSTGCTPA